MRIPEAKALRLGQLSERIAAWSARIEHANTQIRMAAEEQARILEEHRIPPGLEVEVVTEPVPGGHPVGTVLVRATGQPFEPPAAAAPPAPAVRTRRPKAERGNGGTPVAPPGPQLPLGDASSADN